VPVPEADDPRGKHVEGERPAPRVAGADNPWTPMQVFASSLLFGALGGGAIAGINFARMGKRSYKVPCIVAGAVLNALWLAVVLRLPDEVAWPIRLGLSLAIALGFSLVQRPTFEAWKEANWLPAGPDDRYRPNKIGLLFAVGLVCLGVQAVAFLVVLAALGKL
jgi:hypothetical protein